jgi:phosphoglycolate phosphatase-like HAD superfamily hydrolase
MIPSGAPTEVGFASMRALALDFDGVISDSAPEAFVVALRTLVELRPGSPLAAAAAEPSDHPGVYRQFLALMPLGNRAEDYAVALEAIASAVPIESQDDYDRLFAAQDPELLERFHRRFYEVRRAWAERDPGSWREAMAPYPGFLELLRRRAGDAELAIATAKDRATVRALLEAYGVDDLFPEEKVLDKEAGRSKRAHLEQLSLRLGLPLPDLTFVDDKVNHLQSVAPLGVRCALATWGYNGPRERDLARRQGFLVLGLSDAEHQLFR